MKYDKIVEISKERSRQNTEVALRAIEEMLREGEWITVAELAKRTKLSRANFYVKAYREQGACYNPKQIIVDKVMEEKLNTLKIAVTKLKKENIKLTLQNEELLKEIERLKLQLEKK